MSSHIERVSLSRHEHHIPFDCRACLVQAEVAYGRLSQPGADGGQQTDSRVAEVNF